VRLTTITETCCCGATFTTTSDAINASMNAADFRRAHEKCIVVRDPQGWPLGPVASGSEGGGSDE
jgi:hypothetical protein